MSVLETLNSLSETIRNYNSQYGKKQVGTVFNIPIYITVTWVIVTILFIHQIYTNPAVIGSYPAFILNLFNYTIPTSNIEILMFSIAIPISVYGSIFLHELGHAVVANHFNIPTKRIELFVLGGAAKLQQIPHKPKEKFLVATAGPVVTVIIVLITSILTLIFQSIELALITTITFSVLIMNILILGINLLPIYPLDGGQVFHAILTHTQTAEKGIKQSVTIANISAVSLSISGIVLTNPVICLFGLFIYSAAQKEKKRILHEVRKNRELLQQIRDSTIVIDDSINLTTLKITTPENQADNTPDSTTKTIDTDDLEVTGREFIQNIITENEGRLQDSINQSTDYIMTSSDKKSVYSSHKDQYDLNIITVTELINDVDELYSYRKHE